MAKPASVSSVLKQESVLDEPMRERLIGIAREIGLICARGGVCLGATRDGDLYLTAESEEEDDAVLVHEPTLYFCYVNSNGGCMDVLYRHDRYLEKLVVGPQV